MRWLRPLAVVPLLLVAGLAAALPTPPVPPLPQVSDGNVLVLADGYVAERVTGGHPFATSIAWRDGKLLLVENARYHYADPYAGQKLGKLTEISFDAAGNVSTKRTVVDGLEDPIGVAVAPNGDVYLSHYRRVSVISAASYDAGAPSLVDHSTGYPSHTSDVGYLPVTGEFVPGVPSESLDGVDTTGTNGMAFHPVTGALVLAQGANGPPPDDVLVRELTGNDYDDPYSSSVMMPRGGPVTPDQVAARACRNCLDLAFAPAWSPFAGELFIAENVGPYRGRLAAGSGRTVLEGSTPTDNNVLDGINHVDLESGQIRRVATFRPDSGIGGIVPTGIAFGPQGMPDFEGEMFVALFSGFVPPSDDRGEISIVRPEMTLGAATGLPFATGLDFPIDLAFGPDGALYVLEFYTGGVWRFRHAG